MTPTDLEQVAVLRRLGNQLAYNLKAYDDTQCRIHVAGALAAQVEAGVDISDDIDPKALHDHGIALLRAMRATVQRAHADLRSISERTQKRVAS